MGFEGTKEEPYILYVMKTSRNYPNRTPTTIISCVLRCFLSFPSSSAFWTSDAESLRLYYQQVFFFFVNTLLSLFVFHECDANDFCT